MNPSVTPDIREVIEAVHYRPAVSLILPFEPQMSLTTELSHTLKLCADKIEKELKLNYPPAITEIVMQKMRTLISKLNFNTYKKSIALYVSPVFEKVLYLDVPVEEKIIIDESFEIRDLVFSKKEIHKYIVLLLSGRESRMYIGNTTSFVRVISDRPETSYAYINDGPEKVSNFSDLSEHREILMNKFLHHIDQSLSIVVRNYRLPVFVLGTDRIVGHFRSLTRNAASVVGYIHGNYEAYSEPQLKALLQPHVSDWKLLLQQKVMAQLNEAANQKKLSIGMSEVWKSATQRKGRLLVVEKNYMYPAEQGSEQGVIYQAGQTYNRFSYIRDAVDDVMEKVLENGGDVEFVDDGILESYEHIALIEYY